MMYAVIFKAKTKELDDAYFKMAKGMRELAINEYGCVVEIIRAYTR